VTPLTMSAERLDEIRMDLRSPCSHFPRSRPDLLLAEVDALTAELVAAEAENEWMRGSFLEAEAALAALRALDGKP